MCPTEMLRKSIERELQANRRQDGIIEARTVADCFIKAAATVLVAIQQIPPNFWRIYIEMLDAPLRSLNADAVIRRVHVA